MDASCRTTVLWLSVKVYCGDAMQVHTLPVKQNRYVNEELVSSELVTYHPAREDCWCGPVMRLKTSRGTQWVHNEPQ
jgi:hypothetical protein